MILAAGKLTHPKTPMSPVTAYKGSPWCLQPLGVLRDSSGSVKPPARAR